MEMSALSRFKTISGAPRAAAWLAIFFFLGPFIYSFAFCFPRGDDFDEITRAMFFLDLPGAAYEIAREWLTWSGRYTYHFLAVFLARAAESRFLYGSVCAAIVFLYAAGFKSLASLAGVSRKMACLISGMAILALFASFQYLQNFYLLTDSLTMNLQGALFILFLAAICRLCRDMRAPQAPGKKKPWLAAAIIGALAIGTYEHAALAVFWTTLSVILFSLLTAPPASGAGEPARGKMRRLLHDTQSLWWLLLCFAGALSFSFLAPGNFQRRIARNVDPGTQLQQIQSLWPDWCAAIASFAQSPWILAVPCVAAFLLGAQKKHAGWPPIWRIHAAICAITGYLFFSICLITLHALSDMPFSISLKFTASLQLYTATAYAFILCFLLPLLMPPLSPAARKLARALGFIGLLLIAAMSENFLKTAINAASGEMALDAWFMEKRFAYLTHISPHVPNSLRDFGVAGEILKSGVRHRQDGENLPDATVCAKLQPVFPIAVFQDWTAQPAGWPNEWVARLYGIGGARAEPPQPPGIKTLPESGGEYHIPAPLFAAGVTRAWRFDARGQNPTFDLNWLALETAAPLPSRVYLLRPNPLSSERLLPMWLQKLLLGELLLKTQASCSFRNRLAASLLIFEPEKYKKGDLYLFPAGMALPGDATWPAGIFASLDGLTFHRLNPYMD